MNATLKSWKTWLALATLSTLGWSLPASAQTQTQPYFLPPGQGQPYPGQQQWHLGVNAVPHVHGVLIFQHKHGMRVQNVQPHSPASRSGLEAGDIILRVNGRPVSSHSSFQSSIQQSQGFLRMDVKNWRNGQVVAVNVQLEPLGPVYYQQPQPPFSQPQPLPYGQPPYSQPTSQPGFPSQHTQPWNRPQQTVPAPTYSNQLPSNASYQSRPNSSF